MTEFAKLSGLPRGYAAGGDEPIVLRPVAIVGGATATAALDAAIARPLAGGPRAFLGCEVFLPDSARRILSAAASVPNLLAWAAGSGTTVVRAVDAALARVVSPRQPLAGLLLDRPRIMGIVNVTPDSFSDGGDFADPREASRHADRLVAAGADILDVGGESTRPGAQPVPAEAQIARVVPVIERAAGAGAVVSVDTCDAQVMRAGIAAGARIVNDVSALTRDPAALAAVAESDACVVLGHMLGSPAEMQRDPRYDHAPYEIARYLSSRVAACVAAGIAPGRIVVDPGIGFGKTLAHNLALLDSVAILHGTGCAVCVGASRKGFIGSLSGDAAPKGRLAGSLSAALMAAAQGVQILRVHDVAETRQALAVQSAIAGEAAAPL